MTARNLLESIQLANRQIGRLLRLQTRLRDKHRGMLEHSPAAAERVMQQSQALAEEILQLYQGLEVKRERLCRLIDRLPDPGEREVLKLLYLTGLTVNGAAEVLNFSLRHTYRVKAQALKHLQALLGTGQPISSEN